MSNCRTRREQIDELKVVPGWPLVLGKNKCQTVTSHHHEIARCRRVQEKRAARKNSSAQAKLAGNEPESTYLGEILEELCFLAPARLDHRGRAQVGQVHVAAADVAAAKVRGQFVEYVPRDVVVVRRRVPDVARPAAPNSAQHPRKRAPIGVQHRARNECHTPRHGHGGDGGNERGETKELMSKSLYRRMFGGVSPRSTFPSSTSGRDGSPEEANRAHHWIVSTNQHMPN